LTCLLITAGHSKRPFAAGGISQDEHDQILFCLRSQIQQFATEQ
jgi:hypothetical protein